MAAGTTVDCINLSTDDEDGPESDVDTPEKLEESEGRLSCPLCSDCRNVSETVLRDHMWKHSDVISDSPENDNASRLQPVTISPPVRRPVYRPFSCYVCRATYGTVSELKEHLKTHAKIRSSNPIALLTSPKPLPRPTHPRANSQFKCPKCSMTFNKLPFLKRHIRTHVDNQNFVCPICSYRCARAHNLKLHMRLHEQFS